MITSRTIISFGLALLIAGFFFRNLPNSVDPNQIEETRHRFLGEALRGNPRKLEAYDRRIDSLKNRLPMYSRIMMIVGLAIAAIGVALELTGILQPM